MSAKSLLFADENLVLPPSCGPGRQEVAITLQQNGRLYKYLVRDKVTVEDPYLVLVKASAFAIQSGEPYQGLTPQRAVRDFLIKSNVVA